MAWVLWATIGSAGACSDADGEAETPEEEAERLLDCEDPDFTVVQPLAGPGYDPAMGLVDPQSTYVVSTTQIMVAEDGREAFFADVMGVRDQLVQTPGLVAVGFANDPNCGYDRTLAVWRSEEAMYAFVTSDAHLTAMGNAPDYTIAGRVTHWEVEAAEIPIDWDEVLDRIADVEPLEGYGE